MKRKSVKLVLGVILAVLLLPISPALAGEASAESDIELAKEIARVEVAKNVGVYPEWEGAEATGGQPYCNVGGDVICYWFAVSEEGKVLGSVVVGSSLYEHAIFQVGSGSPPSTPTADEVCSSVEKCLGLEVTQKDIGEPLRLVYVTYSFYFAIYDIEGQLIAIDLVRKEAVPASELMMMIASPEQYRQYKEGRAKPLGGGKSLNLSVPKLDMAADALYDDHENNNNCGPTSGSMIVVYHRNETGYTNFDDWPDCHSDPDDGTGGLYYTMKCNDPLPGVTWTDAGPGWVAYAESCGYSFNYNHGWAQLDSYEAIMTYINQGNPLMIMFANDPNYTSWHWCVIKGYEQDGADQICINDPQYFNTKLPWELHYPYTWLTAIVPIMSGEIVGEVRDANGDLLSNVYVSLYEHGGGFYGDDVASPDYCIEVDQTGEYWLRGSKDMYFTLDTNTMPKVRNPYHPDYIWSGYTLDFEGDYGLVPKACSMLYACKSINHWLYTPIDEDENPHPEWQLSSWKASQSVHSWQFPS